MASGIDENIVGLDVPVDVVHFVHVLDGQDEFADIKLGLLFCENVFLDEQTQQISSGHPLHHDVEVRVILEGGTQLDEPLGPALGETLSL